MHEKYSFTTESHTCHILLLSVLQIYFVDIHVCVYFSYKESLIMLMLVSFFIFVVVAVVAVIFELTSVVGALAFAKGQVV